MSASINKAYSLAALLIHASKQEVTKEKIMSVFSALNLEASPKIASMFELSSSRYQDIISNIGSAPAASAGTSSSNGAAPAAEAPAEESESSDDAAIDF